MSEWKTVPISEVADCCLGKMLDAKKNKGELRPYLNNVAVRWGSFDLVDLPEMRIEDDEVERYSVVKGDIVMCEGGEPGRCAVWKLEEPVFIQKALHRIRVKNVADPMFVYYQLCHLVRSGETRSLESGSTIRHLPGQALQEVKLSLPSLSVQNRIAAVLSSLDDKIENNRKICKNLEEQAQAIFKSWFVDFEPFGGEMPKEWRWGALYDLLECNVHTYSPKEKWPTVSYLDTGNITQNRIDTIQRMRIDEAPSRARRKVSDRSIVYSTVRPNLLHYGILMSTRSDMLVSTGFAVLDAKCGASPFRAYLTLTQESVTKHLHTLAEQSVCTYPAVNPSDILQVRSVIVPTAVERKFDATVAPLFEMVEKKSQESRALAELRDALLPKLMSGEIDADKVEV